MSDDDATEDEVIDDASQSMKTEVVEILFDQLCPTGDLGPTRSIATSDAVVAAIHERNRRNPGAKSLSSKNVANFLKDFIRKPTCNRNWPRAIGAKRITARQVYGKGQVFEFVRFVGTDTVPFPDRFDPTADMPDTPFETLSLPLEARALGRQDEPWLIQVAVSQRIVHAHLAIHASAKGLHVESLAHLQTSVKTQPEIDATFIATVRHRDRTARLYVTVEAKQISERILEHQIREQVAKAFEFTASLRDENAVDGILPMALKVVEHKGVRGIYVVQFQSILRSDFDANFAVPERLHEMPLSAQSRSFFEPFPKVAGVSYKKAPTPRSKGTKGKS